MKLKYYLRGLGIGIVVTAILMGVATKDSGQMTDAEIKEQAAQLGMVEQKVLADIANNGAVSEENSQLPVSPTVPPEVIENLNDSENLQAGESLGQETAVEQPDTEAGVMQPEETGDATQLDAETDAAQPDNEGDAAQSEDTSDVTSSNVETDEVQTDGNAESTGNLTEEGDVILLTVRSGASSWTVSKDLEASGLVADAAEFDKFLSQGGYDKSISVGEFSIQMGASYEEIAQIITKRR